MEPNERLILNEIGEINKTIHDAQLKFEYLTKELKRTRYQNFFDKYGITCEDTLELYGRKVDSCRIQDMDAIYFICVLLGCSSSKIRGMSTKSTRKRGILCIFWM